MSMSIEQRRVQVIDTQVFPAARVRLVKASSRYDRRFRYWVVEVLPSRYSAAPDGLAEHMWQIVNSWPVGNKDAELTARATYTASWLTARALSVAFHRNEGS